MFRISAHARTPIQTLSREVSDECGNTASAPNCSVWVLFGCVSDVLRAFRRTQAVTNAGKRRPNFAQVLKQC